MAMLGITKLNWQEPAAYGFTVLSLIGGGLLSYFFHPDWMGRAGSLVIVCGVLLAASRKYELLQSKATETINSARAREIASVKKMLTSPAGHGPSDKEVEQLVDGVINDAHLITRDIIEQRKRVFKLHEIILVVGGTLVNGFGSWLVGLLV